MNFWLLFNTLLGCAIVGFILYMAWLVVRYVYLRLTKPEVSHKFPVLALLIFLFCCGFYAIAFILDYSGSI